MVRTIGVLGSLTIGIVLTNDFADSLSLEIVLAIDFRDCSLSGIV